MLEKVIFLMFSNVACEIAGAMEMWLLDRIRGVTLLVSKPCERNKKWGCIVIQIIDYYLFRCLVPCCSAISITYWEAIADD